MLPIFIGWSLVRFSSTETITDNMLKICEDVVSVFILWVKRRLSSAESINRVLTRPSEQIKLVNGSEDSSAESISITF